MAIELSKVTKERSGWLNEGSNPFIAPRLFTLAQNKQAIVLDANFCLFGCMNGALGTSVKEIFPSAFEISVS